MGKVYEMYSFNITENKCKHFQGSIDLPPVSTERKPYFATLFVYSTTTQVMRIHLTHARLFPPLLRICP